MTPDESMAVTLDRLRRERVEAGLPPSITGADVLAAAEAIVTAGLPPARSHRAA